MDKNVEDAKFQIYSIADQSLAQATSITSDFKGTLFVADVNYSSTALMSLFLLFQDLGFYVLVVEFGVLVFWSYVLTKIVHSYKNNKKKTEKGY